PDRFHDVYREDLLARIESKIQAGQTHMLTEPQAQDTKPASSAKVIDLMSMLRQSIESRAPKKTGSGASRHRSEDDAETPAAGKTSPQARKSRPAARTAGKTASAAAKTEPAARAAKSTRKAAAKTASRPARKSGSRR